MATSFLTNKSLSLDHERQFTVSQKAVDGALEGVSVGEEDDVQVLDLPHHRVPGLVQQLQ